MLRMAALGFSANRPLSAFEELYAWRFAHASNPSNTAGEQAVVLITMSNRIVGGIVIGPIHLDHHYLNLR